MPNHTVQLSERIANIPGEEWWKSSSEETFNQVALQLKEKGFSDDEIIEMLERLHSAVESEYGD